MRLRFLFYPASLLFVAWPALVFGQVPAGPEFRVNTYITSGQSRPSVAMDAAGNFVVAWTSLFQDRSLSGVFGQRYDALGTPRGVEFQVNTYTPSYQYSPSVAMDAVGNFVVAWTGNLQDGSSFAVFGQRYDALGAPRGVEFRVNTYTTSTQYFPSVAMDAAGNFVVAWQSNLQDGSSWGVFGQRYDALGTPRGAEFRVNTYTTDSQRLPSVAVDGAGDFVVAWQSYPQDGSSWGVFGQRYDASGAPRGAEFRVNTYTTSYQYSPSVDMDATGNFVVAWQSYPQDGSSWGVFGQRYDASGAPRGAEFRVNTYTTSYQYSPSVDMDATGNFVVAWSSDPQDGSSSGVFGQRYDALGAPRGAEFRVNTYTTSTQSVPSVAMDAAGNFVMAWSSYLQDGSSAGIFGQRFGGLQPVGLAVDAPGNSVWEPGEFAEVKPSWRNISGSTVAFGGSLANFTGPAGAIYGIPDGTASYGSVANNTSAPCTDCYTVAVSNPPSRPVTHWDASVVETITPDAQGQAKRWLLHIGGSFTDVPTTSPFYRFIETLLHKGVTGGCSGTTYCPSVATTREQMAAFVLVAREGAGYAPAACAPPNVFNDVPETSPFCRFIEELANRGVVSGCGGGNYCPGSPVTREQMAIFVLRTLDPALNPPACVAGSEQFADVPAASAFCRWVEELARRGVVTGCGGGNYCPTAPVTREQMGVFLSVTFGLSLYGPG